MTSRCFNGAATGWPRNAAGLEPRILEQWRLQWGRDRMAAERLYEGGRRRVHTVASMGPRPDGRGTTPACGCSASAQAASMGPRPDGRGTTPQRTAC